MSTFERERVQVGEVIQMPEISRRLSYELQLPLRFGRRIAKAYARVMQDALQHGEGIRLNGVGVLRFKEYDTDTVKLPTGVTVPRCNMYKHSFILTKKGVDTLKELTAKTHPQNYG